ncbi:hypothetical protein L1049_024763 [Liquidambar formosana]|uniref:ATP-dependent DNA helicase n=1 Tax=Liquidambar formosana TaxID=63359 RepID=A0AAP0RW90_LIQFO
MKFVYSAIAAYRNYSIKSPRKSTTWDQYSFKNRNHSAKTKWTDQQSQILDAISKGKSVFITGSAGTGKTVLLKRIIKILKPIHGPSRVFVTASTGVAACALRGQTLHTFAGIGAAKLDREMLLQRVFSDERAALVIDEISMIDGELFENIEHIARAVRYEFTDEVGIRRGESNPDDLKLLVHRCSKAKPDPSVVQLHPRNEDVNRVNADRMKSLEEETIVYTAVDSGKNPWKSQLEQGLAPTHLEVMSKPEKNSVLNLSHKDLLPIVKFDSGETVVIEPETWDVTEGDLVVATRKQIPLVLAWALSVHKCQGMTLDRLHTDLSRACGCGMVYVALSRVRSLEGLHLSGFRSSRIIAHPKVLQYYQQFASNHDMKAADDGANEGEK